MPDSSRRRLRLGYIGCGAHSRISLHPALMTVDEIDWVAVCDKDEARLNQAADRWRVPARYTDYRAMVEQENLDAVALVAPPYVMPPIAMDVLEMGKPLLMEKPIAVDVETAITLAETARRKNVPAMMATMWRHSDAFRRMREIVAGPGFGPITHVEGRFHAVGPSKPYDGFGGGAPWAFILGQGIHLIDATRSIAGDIAEVSAFLNGDMETFHSCAANVKFASGATGCLSMAAHSPHYAVHHRVCGTGGTVSVENLRELTSLTNPHWTGEPVKYESAPARTWNAGTLDTTTVRVPGFVEEFRYFARCVTIGERPRASLDDGVAGIKALKAIYDSAIAGGKVLAVL